MIIFFYGEDDFRLKQAIKKLKEKFISASLGDTNLAILDGKIATYDEIVRQILAMPFLSRTRLVIIENLISTGKKDVQEKVIDFLKKVPSSTVLLFTEEKPDKRTSLFKKLIKADKIQEFQLLNEDKLKKWIRKEVGVRGGEIAPDAISKLIEYIGTDLWRMSNELDKLVTYNPQVTTENINLLVKSQVESDVFKMIDAIGSKDIKSALKEYQNLYENRKNDLYILTMVVYQFRNLLIIKDELERSPKNPNQWEIAKKTGMHPYVVGKSISQSKKFTLTELKNSFEKLLDFDLAIKTGKIESRTALNLLIAKFCV